MARRKSKKYSLLVLLVVLVGFAVSKLMPAEPVAGDFSVHFIDVGQGDSILLSCEGEYMLIDAGTAESTEELLAYLRQQGVKDFRYMVATHPHADHIGGMTECIEEFGVEQFLMPKVTHTSKTFENMVKALQSRSIPVHAPQAGEQFQLGGATCTVLSPVEEAYDDLNNYSIALRVTYGETSFLFTGDMEAGAEQAIAGPGLASDVLKAGHHGSNTSSCAEFLAAVQPQYAVISCGADNSYGHPHKEVLQRFASGGTTVLRTDLLGSIVAVSDGQEISWQY